MHFGPCSRIIQGIQVTVYHTASIAVTFTGGFMSSFDGMVSLRAACTEDVDGHHVGWSPQSLFFLLFPTIACSSFDHFSVITNNITNCITNYQYILN